MARATTTNPSSPATTAAQAFQDYYVPQLLKATEEELILGDYGMQKPIPSSGATGTIRFFRPRPANTTGVRKIDEGVIPTELTEVTRGYVDVLTEQRGALAEITDVLQAKDLVDTLDLYVKTMGKDAALDFDGVIRAAIAAGLKTYNTASSNAKYGTYGYFERFANVTPTADPAADWATLAGASASSSCMTRLINLGCATTLQDARVPKRGGRFVAAVPPRVMHDIRKDTTWLAAAVNVNNQALFKHGVIELDGVVFVEHTNPHKEDAAGAYGTYAANGDVLSCFYFGEGAFGVPKLDSAKVGSNPRGPQIIVLPNADKSDPLNQVTKVGWKAYYGAGLLVTNEASDRPYVLSLRVKSTHV